MQQRVKAALLSLPGTGMSMGECQRELQAPLVLYLVSKSNIEVSMWRGALDSLRFTV